MENDPVVQKWNHSWVTSGRTIHDYSFAIVHCNQAFGRNLPESDYAALRKSVNLDYRAWDGSPRPMRRWSRPGMVSFL